MDLVIYTRWISGHIEGKHIRRAKDRKNRI